MLPLSFLSFSLCTPSFHSQSQAKCTFPSWHLNQHIRANSHIYQICQLTNGRAGEQREIHIKRLRFQFEIYSTSKSSRRHIYKNHSSRHQERVTSSSIIKDWTDHCNKKGQYVPNTSRRTASSVLEGVICQRQQKGVGLWATVQEGVTSSDTQHHDTEWVHRGCQAVSWRLFFTSRTSDHHAFQERSAWYLANHCYSGPGRAAICLGSTRASALCTHVWAVILSRPPGRPGEVTRTYHYATYTTYCTTD